MNIANATAQGLPCGVSIAAELYNRSKCDLFDAFIGHPTVYYHS